MSITLDKSLGTIRGGASSALTTSAAAEPATRILLFFGWSSAGAASTLTSVSGGGLSWTVDHQAATAGFAQAGVASAEAPAGLASSTVITATFSDVFDNEYMAAGSFFGIATSDFIEDTDAAGGTGTAWTTGSLSAGTDCLAITAASCASATASSDVPTPPSLELHDFNEGAGNSLSSVYQIGPAGAYTLAGTWTGTTITWVTSAVAYAAVGGGSADAAPHRRSGRGAGW